MAEQLVRLFDKPALNSELRLVPARQFLFKIASRCNLNCTYCYMYHSADQSWRLRPKMMSEAVVDQALRRIREHALEHSTKRLSIILHGGEPLLVGPEYLIWFLQRCQDALGDIVMIDFGMQTNATLLNEELIDILALYKVSVGVSLDGAQPTNDVHRIYHNGESSYGDVLRGWNLLGERAPQLPRGILCTINLDADPLETYRHLASLRPRTLDFLWPLGNYEAVPYGKVAPYDDTPYADWLIPIFDNWYMDDVPFLIRTFREIIALLLGSFSKTESWGLEESDLLVIETDGQLEGVDTLKSTYEGAASFGLNVFDHTINAAMLTPLMQLRQHGKDALSEQCQRCSLVEVCGGDYLPHRYHPQTGFRTTSIYCADRMKLITHVRSRLLERLKMRPRVQAIV
jgi:uncharacterized protein